MYRLNASINGFERQLITLTLKIKVVKMKEPHMCDQEYFRNCKNSIDECGVLPSFVAYDTKCMLPQCIKSAVANFKFAINRFFHVLYVNYVYTHIC